MKTKQEIREEIIELHGAALALGDVLDMLNKQHMEKIKQMFALSNMLKEMDNDGEKNE